MRVINDIINNSVNTQTNQVEHEILVQELDEWSNLINYCPEIIDPELDTPFPQVNEQFFQWFAANKQMEDTINDIMLAHKVIKSGVPNRFGCHIPVKSCWNIPLFESLLQNYHNKEVIEWLQFVSPCQEAMDTLNPCQLTVTTLELTSFQDLWTPILKKSYD